MFSFSGALLISLVVSVLILRWATRGGIFGLGMDHDLDSVQKIHTRPAPRIGGLAVFLATVLGTLFVALRDPPNAMRIGLVCVCAIPAFAGGLAEDTTGRISPRIRMACMAVSCALGFWLADLVIPRVDIAWLDPLLAYRPVAMLLTAVALITVTNSVNIIDGFNGLAGVVCSIMLLALAYVGLKVGDPLIVSASLVLAGVGGILGPTRCPPNKTVGQPLAPAASPLDPAFRAPADQPRSGLGPGGCRSNPCGSARARPAPTPPATRPARGGSPSGRCGSSSCGTRSPRGRCDRY